MADVPSIVAQLKSLDEFERLAALTQAFRSKTTPLQNGRSVKVAVYIDMPAPRAATPAQERAPSRASRPRVSDADRHGLEEL